MNTLGAHNYLLKDERRGKQPLQTVVESQGTAGPGGLSLEGCPWSGLFQVVCASRLISGRCIDDIFLLKLKHLCSGHREKLIGCSATYGHCCSRQVTTICKAKRWHVGGVMKEKLSTWYPPRLFSAYTECLARRRIATLVLTSTQSLGTVFCIPILQV